MASTIRQLVLIGALSAPFLAAEDHGKPPAKAEHKAEAKHDAKPAAKPDAKPDPKHDPKPAAKHDAKPDPKHDPKPAAKPSALGEATPPKAAPPPPKPVLKAPLRHATRAQRPRTVARIESVDVHGEEHEDAPISDVLAELAAGNRRFVTGRPIHPRQNATRLAAMRGREEQPRVCILTCTDARVAPEIIFDQGIGDLHTLRVAGNVAGKDIIASLEMALEENNAGVCVVLGHTGCTVVTSVLEGKRLASLLHPVANAVTRTRRYNPSLKGEALHGECARVNVWQSTEDMLRGSEMIATRVRTGILKLTGALYHADTGTVEWLGSYPGALSILRE
ncbi:MAG: hypothetical protein JNK48_33800 [Bryobacterales bacterium]|nr:hypothetical protein [Bryobacterales bacterium]